MAYKTITILGDPIRKERTAAGAITPGHLVQINSDGDTVVHASAGGIAQRSFALEDDLQGNEIGDAYASADQVQIGFFRPGDEVYAWLDSGDNVVIGDYLESNGDGLLRIYASGVRLAIALEALDLSGSGAVDTRIRVEIV